MRHFHLPDGECIQKDATRYAEYIVYVPQRRVVFIQVYGQESRKADYSTDKCDHAYQLITFYIYERGKAKFCSHTLRVFFSKAPKT